MIKRRDPFLKILLAVLPVLVNAAHFHEALFLASLVTLVFWGSAVVLGIARRGFPARLRNFGMVLWLTAVAQIGNFWLGLTPLWVVSVYLLLPEEWGRAEEPTREGFRQRLRSALEFAGEQLRNGAGFWVVMVYLGICQEIFAARFFVWIFAAPAGSFLLLSLASALWQNQPAKETAAFIREGRES
jgi:hypothetical protein